MSSLGAVAYVGNKQEIFEKIEHLFPQEYNRFVDLFCGGLSVALNVEGDVLANDIQSPLIEMYEQMRTIAVDDIKRVINDYDLSKDNKENYYRLRSDYNKTKNPLLLLVLHYYSFSNMFRFNKCGNFSVPFGQRQFNNNSLEKFNHFKRNCERITFESKHYKDVEIKEGDFVYIDPPYLITKADYNKFWSPAEETRLYEFVDNLHKKGIQFGMSNVFRHHDKTNNMLIDWCESRPDYFTHYLNKQYVYNIYHTKSKSTSQEVYITNCITK